MRVILIFGMVIALFGCTQNGKYPLESGLTTDQYFDIICNRDTTVIDKNGIKIHIQANTFDCGKDDRIRINFSAIRSKHDMVVNKMYTISENGNFLETAGMFRIQSPSNSESQFRHPITLEIPTTHINYEMSKHLLEYTESHITTWVDTQEKLTHTGTSRLVNGAKLFEANCSMCHSTIMNVRLSGPPLGNVHLFRELDWLIQFTKHSQKMIAEGDSLSLCLWQQWQPVMMNEFEHLSDEEIKDIYEFIANESMVQKIGLDEVLYITECEEITVDMELDTFTQPVNTYYYNILISSENWVNADYLAIFKDTIAPIVVELDKAYENLNMVLVFENRNIVVPFEEHQKANQYSLWHPTEKDKIMFPLGEKVKIIAISISEDFRYNIIDYQPKKEDNLIRIRLEKGNETEFLKRLKQL